MTARGNESNWRDIVQASLGVTERLKRNVLEINLEKDEGNNVIEEEDISSLLKRLGINQQQVEGVQLIPPKGPKKIFVWFEQGIDINRFCYNEAFRLIPGVKTGVIKPMDRREVEVTISGLNINTPDSSILNYLSYFGKIVKHEVIYLRNKSGPFQGLKNGDRKYFIDFTNGRNLDSYHLIDGAKVTVRYRGQRRTCGRCN